MKTKQLRQLKDHRKQSGKNKTKQNKTCTSQIVTTRAYIQQSDAF